MKKQFLLSAAVLLLISKVSCLDNGLGKKPAMGWNTWNLYDCAINETIVKANADQIVALGLDKLGYKYVNLDDCWQAVERDE